MNVQMIISTGRICIRYTSTVKVYGRIFYTVSQRLKITEGFLRGVLASVMALYLKVPGSFTGLIVGFWTTFP